MEIIAYVLNSEVKTKLKRNYKGCEFAVYYSLNELMTMTVKILNTRMYEPLNHYALLEQFPLQSLRQH